MPPQPAEKTSSPRARAPAQVRAVKRESMALPRVSVSECGGRALGRLAITGCGRPLDAGAPDEASRPAARGQLLRPMVSPPLGVRAAAQETGLTLSLTVRTLPSIIRTL